MLLTEMTWDEVKNALAETDLAIIPVGSCEQHSLHLPLGTDFLAALELAKRVASQVNAVVVPVLIPGYSPHHMGFPGTITISQGTFVQVLYEACQSLVSHGFRRILILNAHGGNDVACKFLSQKANETLGASVLTIGSEDQVALIANQIPEFFAKLDFHAGIEETGWALALFPELVHMEKAKAPKIQLPPGLANLIKDKAAGFRLLTISLPPMKEISDTGALTLGDPKEAKEISEEIRGRVEKYVNFITDLVRRWRQVG